MEALRLNAVKIYNRERSSLSKKPWATRLSKTTTSWKNNVNNFSRTKATSDLCRDIQIKIPVNKRLFGCLFCVLLPCPTFVQEPDVEKNQLETMYTGSALRYLGRLVPINCNLYESVLNKEVYLLYEGILFVVTVSFKALTSRGLQTRLGNLEYYDFLGLMDGQKGRPLPHGHVKLPELSFAVSRTSETYAEVQRTLDIAVNQ